MLTFVRRPLTPEGATLASRGVVLGGKCTRATGWQRLAVVLLVT